jgi:hypothetical protein
VVVAVIVFLLFRLVHASLASSVIGGIAVGLIVSQYRLILDLLKAAIRAGGALTVARTGRPFWFALPSILVGLLGLLTVAYLLLNPAYIPQRYSTLTVLFVTIVVILLIPAWFFLYGWIAATAALHPRRMRRALLGVYFAVSFAVQIVIGYGTLRPPGFDAATVFGTAVRLADRLPATSYAVNSYFPIYPINIFTTLALSKYFLILHALGLASNSNEFLFSAVVLNGALLLVATLLAYLVARRIAGTRAAVITLVFSTVFLTVSPWIGTPYTDIYSMVFPILILYLYLLLRGTTVRWRRYLIWIVIGAATGLGYSIKPTVIFALAAIVLVELARLVIERVGRRRVVSLVIAFAVVAVSFTATAQAAVEVSNHGRVVPWNIRQNTRELPITHFLAMGAQGTGAYSHADAQASGAIKSPSARFKQGIVLYLQRVEKMGPSGYAGFLGRKAAWTMDDGTFFQWGEGNSRGPFITTTGLGAEIQNYYGNGEAGHQGLVNIWQAFWTILLALLAVPLFIRKSRLFSDEATVLRTAFLGLFVFLMLFETRSRYLYLYLPVVIVLASLSLETIARKLSPLVGRLRQNRLGSSA